MYEVSVSYTRHDTIEDFFPFNSNNHDLFISHAKVRQELINFPGFLSLSFYISSNKLTLTIVTLWDSTISAKLFSSNYEQEYTTLLGEYIKRTGIIVYKTSSILPDSEKVKALKASTRFQIEDAKLELLNSIGPNAI